MGQISGAAVPLARPVLSAHRAWLIPIVMATLAAVLLFPSALNDFDSHHDGYMLAGAVAIRDGAFIHRDVFGQYGPVTPIAQGLFLHVGLPPAVGIRILNVLLIATTVGLISAMPIVRCAITVSRSAYLWGAATWVLMSDALLGSAMLPWSSVLSAFLGTASAYLLLTSLERSGSSSAILAALGGVTAALIPFTRLNSGAVLALTALPIALLAFLRIRHKHEFQRLWIALIAGFGTVVTVSGFLMINGALRPYYQQAIYFPVQQQQEAAEQINSPMRILELFATYSPSVLAVGFGLWFVARYRKLRLNRNSRGSLTLVALLVLAAIQINVLAAAGGPTTHLASYGVHFLELLYILGVASSGIFLILGLSMIYRQRPTGLAVSIVALFSVAALAQGAPLFDARHLWWGLPIAVPLVFALLDLTVGGVRLRPSPIRVSALIAAVIFLLTYVGSLSEERIQLQGPPALQGMRVTPDLADSLQADYKLLTDTIGAASSLMFVVDGDVSVLANKYQASDNYFVRWGFPPRPLGERLAENEFLVVQLPPNGDTQVVDQFTEWYEIVGSSRRLVVLKGRL